MPVERKTNTKKPSSKANAEKARSKLMEYVRRGKEAMSVENELQLSDDDESEVESEPEVVVKKGKGRKQKEPEPELEPEPESKPEPKPVSKPEPTPEPKPDHTDMLLKQIEALTKKLEDIDGSNKKMTEKYDKALASKLNEYNNVIGSVRRSMVRF